MQSDHKKLAYTFVAGLFVGAFRAFVLMLMWNWFVSPVFHTANISFWQVLGLLWLVQVFVGEGEEDLDENRRWERLFAILHYCIPDDQKQWVKQEMDEHNDRIWVQFGMKLFNSVQGLAVTLVLGWLVHAFLV
jgi:hypothetical protein